MTVATNMAGRGTDIMLGGNPEMRAAADLEARGLDPVESPEDYEAAWPDALSKAEESVKAEHEEVTSLGACTCWPPSATSPAVSTTSCGAGRHVRVTPEPLGSTCRSGRSHEAVQRDDGRRVPDPFQRARRRSD